MTDRELLELAAEAAGMTPPYFVADKKNTDGYRIWNPLADDGDALRLAVKLRATICIRPHRVEISTWPNLEGRLLGLDTDGNSEFLNAVKRSIEPHDNDPYAATRRAIVRAAAEIGKGMK